MTCKLGIDEWQQHYLKLASEYQERADSMRLLGKEFIAKYFDKTAQEYRKAALEIAK